MKNKLSTALTLAVVLAMIAATIAWADNLLTDGDGLTPVVDTTSLNLGNVCLGSTTTKPIAHAVNRNGNYPSTNVFQKNTTVTVSIGTVSGSGLSALMTTGSNTISIPNNWDTVSNNTLSSVAYSSVTFVANSLGAFSGTVNYSASGTDSKNSDSLVRTDALTVTATVVNCDTTPPTLHLPDNMTIEATGASGAVVAYTATADDANPAHPAVTCAPASGLTFGFGATTVNCSATDAAGNTASGSFTVTVQDTTPPTVIPPSNITAEAVDGSGATVTYSGESATDTVDGTVAVSCAPDSGSLFSLGETTVTCSAVDSHSNTGTSTFTINVKDTTAPVLALPGDKTIEAASAAGAAVDFGVSASDTVDGSVAVTCDHNSGDIFPLGDTTVSCSATDSNGNIASGSFKVTVEDTTAPIIDGHNAVAAEATSADGANVSYTSPATHDLVDGDGVATCAPASGSLFPLGITSVNCEATDAHGNKAASSFDVNVVDTTPPTLTLPADQQLEATGPDGAVATFEAAATDIVDGNLAVTCSANSGDTFPLGTTTVNCSVKDNAGNESHGSFVIIVEDTTPPVINFVNRTPANGNGWNSSDVTVTWSCSDIVGVKDASVSLVVSDEGANQSVTGICEDLSGNKISDTQSGINIDKTAPVVSVNRNPVANSYGWNNTDVTVSFTGTDELSGIDSCSAAQVFGEGAEQSASGTCTDKAGNVSNPAALPYINVDKTAPTISGAPDRAANVNGWYNADVIVTFTCDDGLSGVDQCTSPVTLGEGAGQNVPGSVTDKAGNSASTTVNGINIDKTAPLVSAVLDKTAMSGWFNIFTGAPTVSFTCVDALSGLAGACPDSYLFGDGKDQAYSQTVYDLAGNSASAGVSDVNVDTVAPTINGVPDRAPNGNGWYNADVTITFTCNDGLSGVASCSGPSTLGEGAAQSVTGSVADNAGNTTNTTVGGVNIDKTAPIISAALDKIAVSGWFNISTSKPTVNFTCSDALSGLDGTCPASHLFNDGKDQSYSQNISDLAGNSASAGVSGVNVDTVAPTISVSLDRSAASTGWFNEATGAPVAQFTCSDATSGVMACPADFPFGNGANQNYTGSVSDNAGNNASATVDKVYVDVTRPTLTWNGGPADGASYYFGFVPAAPTCTAADALSGPNGCAVAGYGTVVGSQTMIATAQDMAGNAYSEFRTYTVSAWTLKGFYQPVDMPNPSIIWNTSKNGSTIPLKFEIFAGQTELTDVIDVKSITYANVACSTGTEDAIETLVTATGGTILRYDTTSGQFIFNWKTPSTAGKCYRVTMTTLDGSTLVAYFKLK